MPLYEIAVISVPSKKELEDGTGSEKLIFGPKALVAKNEQAAIFGVAMSDELKGSDLNRLQVLIRPFA